MENGELQNNQGLSREARIIVLGGAIEYVDALNRELSIKIFAAIEQVGTAKTDNLLIKPLKGKLMELSVNQYRVVFFRRRSAVYVVDVFKKQSRKTPPRVIKRAWKIYKKFE